MSTLFSVFFMVFLDPAVCRRAHASRPTASRSDGQECFRYIEDVAACKNIKLGVCLLLYPDQKFKLEAASPGANTINVNVLFVDENDQLALRQAKPQWDQVRKTWVYESVVPLVQFNDITTPVEKTFTIKTQSKYYICADDRKEAGSQDITYLVPVKLTRL